MDTPDLAVGKIPSAPQFTSRYLVACMNAENNMIIADCNCADTPQPSTWVNPDNQNAQCSNDLQWNLVKHDQYSINYCQRNSEVAYVSVTCTKANGAVAMPIEFCIVANCGHANTWATAELPRANVYGTSVVSLPSPLCIKGQW